jgi:hypothetical protein
MTEEPEFTLPRTGPRERHPNDRIIVTCGLGLHYRRMVRSTVNHCAVYCPEAWGLHYDELPIGCPPHSERQYAFKMYALMRAIAAGFRYVLWMDASFAPVASIEPLWERIARDGWFIPKQGDAMLGNWCSDNGLAIFGHIKRDHAMTVPLVYSGLVGLDMRSAVGKSIWAKWLNLFHEGAFDGPHTNTPGIGNWEEHGHKWKGFCSNDPRCEGHRHDEAALAWVLHSMNLTPENSGLLTLESPQGIIGHHVPDFDVVKMRNYLSDYSAYLRKLGDNPDHLEALCR